MLTIIAVRHGESEANLAHERAADRPLFYGRGDDEVRLTDLGRRQAGALGRWLATLPAGEAPEVVWCSPYLRAVETWERARAAWTDLPVTVDVRLRDRDQGDLAGLNPAAVEQRHPAEAAKLAARGEYSYRPPGGETFADVAARLRSLVADLPPRRVLVVAHDAVVLLLRHVLGGQDDADLSYLAEFTPIRNASVSIWRPDLVVFNDTAHLRSES